MRTDRRNSKWAAGAAGVLLFLISGSAGAQSASPSPSSFVDPSPSVSPIDGPSASPTVVPSVPASASPTAAPSAPPTAAPSPSPGFECDMAFAYPEGSDHVVRGGTVRIRFEGFAPNSLVTLVFKSWPEISERPIGTSEADANGNGIVDGLVPGDAPIGEASLRVVADGCVAYTYFVVLGSEAVVSVDDSTVVAGQRVTVTAGGFLPNATLQLSIDSAATQGECFPDPCRYLGVARASDLGSAVFHVRIPRNTAPGKHQLWVTGELPEGITEVSLGVDITVVGADLPSTDMA